MTKEEIKWIKDNQATCESCKHLEIFHVEEDLGTYCLVDNCNCRRKT